MVLQCAQPEAGVGGTKASRAAVGLQYLLGPASENLPMQQSSLARFFEQKKGKIKNQQLEVYWKFKSALGVRKMFKETQHVYDDDDDDDDDEEEEEEEEDEDDEEEEDEDEMKMGMMRMRMRMRMRM